MKKAVLLIIAILIISSGINYSKPKLVFNCGFVYDFGKVKQKDSPLKTEVTIYNQGSDTLIINRVKPMCGCTTAPLSKKEIAPGDSAILKVTLNVEHFEGDINKKISITSNMNDAETDLTLHAFVYKPFKIFPNTYLNFSQMYIGTETTTKLIINNLTGRDVTISDVIFQPEDLVLNVQPGYILPKDSDLVLEAMIIPKTIGAFSSKIELITDEPDEPSIKISGWGRVDDPSQKNTLNDEFEDEVPVTPENPEVKSGEPVKLNPPITPLNVSPGQNIRMGDPPVMKLSPENRMIRPENEIKINSSGPEIKIENNAPVEMPPAVIEPEQAKEKPKAEEAKPKKK